MRAAGDDVIAISHNGNLTDGTLDPRRVTFFNQPVDSSYAKERMLNPVQERARS